MGKNQQLLTKKKKKKSPFRSLFFVTKGPEKGQSSKTGNFQIIKLLCCREHHTRTHCGPNPTEVSKPQRACRSPPQPGYKEAPPTLLGQWLRKPCGEKRPSLLTAGNGSLPLPVVPVKTMWLAWTSIPTKVSEEAQEDSGFLASPTPTTEIMWELKLPSCPSVCQERSSGDPGLLPLPGNNGAVFPLLCWSSVRENQLKLKL